MQMCDQESIGGTEPEEDGGAQCVAYHAQGQGVLGFGDWTTLWARADWSWFCSHGGGGEAIGEAVRLGERAGAEGCSWGVVVGFVCVGWAVDAEEGRGGEVQD